MKLKIQYMNLANIEEEAFPVLIIVEKSPPVLQS